MHDCILETYVVKAGYVLVVRKELRGGFLLENISARLFRHEYQLVKKAFCLLLRLKNFKQGRLFCW